MEDTSSFEQFCGSPFWNQTLTWNTTNPELTRCFEKTALVWTPCFFLWIFSSIEVYYIYKSKKKNILWNWLNISKLCVTAVLFVLTLVELIASIRLFATSDISIIHSVDICSPIIKLLSFAISGILIYYNRKHGQHTSGVLFLFWLLLVICGIPQFRTEIRALQSNETFPESYTHRILFLIYYPIVLLITVLNCFPDSPPTETKYPKTPNPCPEETASFLSRTIFSWFDKLVVLGFRKPLDTNDLWDLNPQDTSNEVITKFEKHIQIDCKKPEWSSANQNGQAKFKSSINHVEFVPAVSKKKVNILPAIWKTFGATFLFGSSFKLIQDLLTFVSPQVLGLVISYVRDANEGNAVTWKGYLYVILLFVTATVQTLFLGQYFHKMFIVGMRMRSALIATIYKKALRISNSARKESTVGEIVNLMSVDAQKVTDLVGYINMIWSAPLQIALALYFLWQELGPSVLAGLAVMILLIPVNGYIANKIKDLQITQMKNKDDRVKTMNEILSGMKVLKLYAWEPCFQSQVMKIRNKEINTLRRAAYWFAGTSFIWSCAPFLVSMITFATYVMIDENNILDANKAYVSISLFNIIRFPLSMLPMLMSNLVQCKVSTNRINKFMNAEDLDPSNVSHEPDEVHALTIEGGTFSWGEDPILKDINVQIKARTLTAVVGSVGAGKSSLVSAFLGEMDKVCGRVNAYGSVAYVAQQAWIQNATLKDNILFGKPYNHKFYDKVIEACALKPDLEILPGGDQTEIGEKGINLSGGQKQRISLARAVYADTDIYYLDDPLSAVDSHVGKHIFEQVIGPKGLLKNKTRILVTHGITYLPQTDNILVIKDGEVSERGTYQELLDRKGAFSEFLLQHISGDGADEEELDELKDQLLDTPLAEELTRQISRHRSASESSDRVRNGSISRQRSVDSGHEKSPRKFSAVDAFKQDAVVGERLIETEKAETGNVSWQVYKYYLTAIGLWSILLVLGFNILFEAFSVGSNIWLGVWADDNSLAGKSGNSTGEASKRDMYLGVYGALGFGQGIFSFCRDITLTFGCLGAAKALQEILLESVLHSPMSFFDTNPLGRILARFSKDIEVVDEKLKWFFSDGAWCLFEVLGTLVVISYTTPMFMTVILPIGLIYYFVQRFYVATSRQLKRIESISRSPIYSHFGETITGAQAIRAFGEQQRFISESERKVDLNQVCYYPGIVSNRWLSIRLEMIGNLIILFAALFAVLATGQAPGLIGLSITYSLQITQFLNWLVRMSSEIETNIVAVERIKEYAEAPQEAPWDIPHKNPSTSWPSIGAVEFKDYAVRYRPGLDLVLKGVDFQIRGGEKVGIVGRTGAGKSSLTLSLFRIIEAVKGMIAIDGVNIAELGLQMLRSKLTIIPQDAILFSGSLRMNLDPYDSQSDEEVWKALEHAHLKSFVKGLAAGLQHEVSEGGENFSVGQRQLICLARALLRKTKVLILDEATAAVDLETDDLIQKTIRTEFKECTVLTIAHRLNTIMDSDRIIVLDKGHIVEFDSPSNLLAKNDSIFAAMHKDAGLS